MPNLEPTHTCFDDALDYISKRVVADPPLAHGTTLVLVHGIATGANGEPYSHAWCEENGQCWDAGIWNGQHVYYSVAAAEYYAARRIQETTRYTVKQACLLNYGSNHYGPWEPRYQALCGLGRHIVDAVEADTSGATFRAWEDS